MLDQEVAQSTVAVHLQILHRADLHAQRGSVSGDR
jgi:hypothetical protein